MSPDGRHLWLSSLAQGSTAVFDTRTGERVATVATPGHPYRGPVVAADGRTVYLPLMSPNQVGVVDLVEKKLIRTLPTGAGPDGIGIARGGG